jgi:hypothetical protein
MNRAEFIDLHLKDYKETWDLQKELHRLRLEKAIPDTLVLVEHEPVVTMGKSGYPTIEQIEAKLAETRRQIFENLTPWQRVQLARHPKRPYALDYVAWSSKVRGVAWRPFVCGRPGHGGRLCPLGNRRVDGGGHAKGA